MAQRKQKSSRVFDLRVGSLNDIVGMKLRGFEILDFDSASEMTYGKDEFVRWVYKYKVKCLMCGKESVIARGHLISTRNQRGQPKVGCKACKKIFSSKTYSSPATTKNKTTGVKHYFISLEKKTNKYKHFVMFMHNKHQITIVTKYTNEKVPDHEIATIANKLNDVLSTKGIKGFEEWRKCGYKLDWQA